MFWTLLEPLGVRTSHASLSWGEDRQAPLAGPIVNPLGL